MKQHHSMGKIEYFIWHIACILIVYPCYQNLFRYTGRHSLYVSGVILCGTAALICVIGGVFEFRRRRNGYNVFLNLVSGFGICTIYTYMQIRKKLITVTLITAAILTVICAFNILCRKVNNRRNIKKIVGRRLQISFILAQKILGISLAFIILMVGIDVIPKTSVKNTETSTASDSNTEEQSLENYIETAALLKQDSWESLSLQERLDVLQAVANMEQRYLGLPDELHVDVSDLREEVLGCYLDAAHKIMINRNSLQNDSSCELLDTVCHEAYHSYQYRMIDVYDSADSNMKSLLLYRKAEIYIKEFGSYINGEEDFCSYYAQNCEEDARAYAKASVKDYCNKINTYYGSEVMHAPDDSQEENQELYTVDYDENGYACLLNADKEVIAGPYLYIEDEMECAWDTACRYTGLNGLIGYLDTEGNELTPPVYMEATEMSDGTALVKEEEGRIYYIDVSGRRITGDYPEGYPFEHQGSFARVRLDSGCWAVINRQGETVFSGADSIEKLPTADVFGSAVRDGHAVLFRLDYGSEEEIRIIKEFDQFVDISIYEGIFAVVRNESGMYGVIDLNGKVIVPDNYKSIDFDIMDDGDDLGYGRYIQFRLQHEEGTYSVENIEI